jgi:hypothetical protein
LPPWHPKTLVQAAEAAAGEAAAEAAEQVEAVVEQVGAGGEEGVVGEEVVGVGGKNLLNKF